MEEKIKYYTPDIAEFCIGFEFQTLEDWRSPNNDKSWSTYTIDSPSGLEDYMNYYRNDYIDGARVKYLDKEDVESLGFSLNQNLETDHEWEWHILDKNGVSIGMYYDYEEGAQNYTIELINAYFNIKNKLEFTKLLKQMNLL